MSYLKIFFDNNGNFQWAAIAALITLLIGVFTYFHNKSVLKSSKEIQERNIRTELINKNQLSELQKMKQDLAVYLSHLASLEKINKNIYKFYYYPDDFGLTDPDIIVMESDRTFIEREAQNLFNLISLSLDYEDDSKNIFRLLDKTNKSHVIFGNHVKITARRREKTGKIDPEIFTQLSRSCVTDREELVEFSRLYFHQSIFKARNT
ncbi:hypothetical protein HCA69_02380 [Listeria grandensis]|uniref:Uncharacterized protein n=1 Tax=Listeria grandensis TaxID=1494963 RepID=A0A7X1CNS5_9LIST|nr:hypothetical protein [Listeria grandensis]MBC1935197.1 hypothetical protein [Listeria grandensis]